MLHIERWNKETSKQEKEIPEGTMPVWFLRTDKYDVWPSSSSETSFFENCVLLSSALNNIWRRHQQFESLLLSHGMSHLIRRKKQGIGPRQVVHCKTGIDKFFQDDDDREIDPEVLEVMKEDMARIGKRNPLLSAWVRERASLSGGTPKRPMQVSGKVKKQYLRPIE